jgi:hypothetical protein
MATKLGGGNTSPLLSPRRNNNPTTLLADVAITPPLLQLKDLN